MRDWNERYHELDYDSAVALRYHGRRMAFIDFASRIESAVVVIFGGGAFAGIVVGFPNIAAGAALFAAIVGAINLALALPEKARQHERLVRKWNRVRADLALVAADDDLALRKIEVKRTKIDAESPWQLLALSALCENEEKTVRRDGGLCEIGRCQLAFINLITFPWWRPIPVATDGAA